MPDQLEDTNHTRYPRVDYLLLKEQLDADLINYSAYNSTPLGSFFRKIETKVRSDLYLAFLAQFMKRKYDVVFTMSERAGIPYSGAKRFYRSNDRLVTMFHCWSSRQEWTITRLGLFEQMDNIIVHCSSMKNRLTRLGAAENRINLIQYGVDQNFFHPMPKEDCTKNIIMSIGEIRSRDYDVLFDAVNGLEAEVNVAASGIWYAREKSRNLGFSPPENVNLTGRLSQLELRKYYANSSFVVLPIKDLPYSAGATGILEAGCMARAVIVTKSRGITDYVINGETGICVEPGDTEGLRDAIEFLIANPEEAARMGQNARRRIEEELNLDIYVDHLRDQIVNEANG